MQNNMAITKTPQWRTTPLHILSSNSDHIPYGLLPLTSLWCVCHRMPRDCTERVTRYGLKSGEKKTCNDAAKRELTRRRFEESGACVSPYIDMRRHGSSHNLRPSSASLFAAAAVAANCIDRRDMVHTASKQLKLKLCSYACRCWRSLGGSG